MNLVLLSLEVAGIVKLLNLNLFSAWCIAFNSCPNVTGFWQKFTESLCLWLSSERGPPQIHNESLGGSWKRVNSLRFTLTWFIIFYFTLSSVNIRSFQHIPLSHFSHCYLDFLIDKYYFLIDLIFFCSSVKKTSKKLCQQKFKLFLF